MVIQTENFRYIWPMTIANKKKMIKGTQPIGPENPTRFLNIMKVAGLTKIDKDKIYNNLKGRYNTLTPAEKKQIATLLMMPLDSMFKRLGMQISFTKHNITDDDFESKSGRAKRIEKD